MAATTTAPKRHRVKTPRRKKALNSGVATWRPATRKRAYQHDELTALDLFSGFGGLTEGVERAGFTAIMAANHNEYKVTVHEANHPHVEHWIANLVDKEASDYHSARDLPYAHLLVAGISCTNHSQANTQKAYSNPQYSLFDQHDEEYEARVTKSERDRATANCVLAYADKHLPKMILIECTTEFTSWGPALPNRPKVGDGTTYKWWLKTIKALGPGYHHRVLYLNSMFFGVPQSRNRIYIVFWQKGIPAPQLDHEPLSWCSNCDDIVPAVWSWKTGVPPTGKVYYGEQYNYRCPRCRGEVIPPMTPSLNALDLTDLGTRIGDRAKPLAPATMARAERCRQRFPHFPAVLMPAKSLRGSDRHPWQPMNTQTSQQETGILSTGALVVAAGNTFEHPGSDCRTRGFDQPLWTQPATNTTGVLTPPVAVTGHVIAAHRHNGDGQPITAPMDTVTSTHEKSVVFGTVNYQGSARGGDESLPTQGGSETIGLLSTATGVVPLRKDAAPRSAGEPLPTQAGGEHMAVLSTGVVPYRKNTLSTTAAESMPTVTSDQIPGLLTAIGTIKNNGGVDQAQYRSHPVTDPLGTLVASSAGQAMLSAGWFKQNGAAGDETVAHQLGDALGTLTARDTTALLAAWYDALADIKLEDCFFRMLGPHEVGRGCGFDVNFPGYEGSFEVWGSARDQVDGFGNAVSPQVGLWIGERLRDALHGALTAV